MAAAIRKPSLFAVALAFAIGALTSNGPMVGVARADVAAFTSSHAKSVAKPENAPPQESPPPATPPPAPSPPEPQQAPAPPATPAPATPATVAPAPAAPTPSAPAPRAADTSPATRPAPEYSPPEPSPAPAQEAPHAAPPRVAPPAETPRVTPPVETRRLVVEPPTAAPQPRQRDAAPISVPRPRAPEPGHTTPDPVILPVPATPVPSPRPTEPVMVPEPVPRRRPGTPVTTPHPGTAPPLVGEPVPIQVDNHFTMPAPRRRPRHAPPIPVFEDHCVRCRWIPVHRLPCGGGSIDEIPAVVFEETTQWSDEDQATRATYYLAPGFARLQYDGLDVILDVGQQLVARIDTKNGVTQVLDVADWQAYVDSATTATGLRLSPRSPRFVDGKTHEVVAGFRSWLFTASTRKTDDEGTRLLVENDVWVTSEMELTREMYAAYRLALYLFDGRCIDLPADRPDGVILRSRLSWHPIKDSNHDNDLVQDSVVESVRYELVPRGFFNVPGPRRLDDTPAAPPVAATRAR